MSEIVCQNDIAGLTAIQTTCIDDARTDNHRLAVAVQGPRRCINRHTNRRSECAAPELELRQHVADVKIHGLDQLYRAHHCRPQCLVFPCAAPASAFWIDEVRNHPVSRKFIEYPAIL